MCHGALKGLNNLRKLNKADETIKKLSNGLSEGRVIALINKSDSLNVYNGIPINELQQDWVLNTIYPDRSGVYG